MHFQASVIYAVQAGYSGASVNRSLKLKQELDELVDCVICQHSRVLLSSSDKQWVTVYDLQSRNMLKDSADQAVWQ